MLTTAGLWLEQSKSRVYLRVILYKESKPTTDLLHFWVEDVKESFRSAVYRHQPHSCKRKQKANRLLSFSFSVMPQVSFQQTTDSSTSIRRKKNNKNKSQLCRKGNGRAFAFLPLLQKIYRASNVAHVPTDKIHCGICIQPQNTSHLPQTTNTSTTKRERSF